MRKQDTRRLPLLAGMALVGGIACWAITAMAPGALGRQGAIDAQLIRCRDGRTPIRTLPFTIQECGSYFLTDCLTGVSGMDGITIDADDVTLDLNGYTLIGVPGSLAGVRATGVRRGITVLDGTVRGWGASGVDLLVATNCRLEGVRAIGNGNAGLTIGAFSVVDHCAAEANGAMGISVGSTSRVDRCRAENNGDVGIGLNDRGTVTNCTAVGNGTAVAAPGIAAALGSLVVGNTSTDNQRHGIEVTLECRVERNDCHRNVLDGIRTTMQHNLVTENHCVRNSRFGISVTSSANLVVKNVAGDNGNSDYDIGQPDNSNAVIAVDPGGDFVDVDPWANFQLAEQP